MSGWNEENFLEKMMPLLEKNIDAGVCPDAQTLCAVADGAAPYAVRQAVEAHASGCPACADVMRRLGEFSRMAPAAAEPEWSRVEKRLDSRMQQFLGAAGPPAQTGRAPWWKFGWVLVPIAALASVLLWIPKPTVPRDTPVARVDTPVPAGAIQDKPAPGVANLSETTKPADMAAAPVSGSAVPAPVENNPVVAPAETAGTSAPPPVAPDTVVEPAPTHAPAPGFAPVVATAGGQTRSAEPAAPAPAYVRINAGTRVWILLQSTSPETNGGFTFRGMVLLPVTQGGAVLLDRQTEVVGTGKVNQGRTTIRIAEFVWQGMRYRLRGVPVALHAPPPGSGPAVEFNAGQVLETWLASPSTYERVPGRPAPQG